ncbi:MAG: ATP-binding cassette domain-containing protein [Coxiellaceae bacterium]|nr:ATP-binding cassette domain-containing protein [Coxiellaceae bacterium]
MAAVIDVHDLGNYLGGQWVHKHLDFAVEQQTIVAIVGGSGSGKTTLLRSILMLQQPQEGSIKLFGEEVVNCSPVTAYNIRRRWGVLFQQSALFSSLTVLENVMFPLKVFTQLDERSRIEIALLKLVMTGLPADAADRYPSELSGGMKKRAALARALARDPELLLLDEPTSGLDPKSASDFDELILKLKNSLKLTIVMVSHDPTSLWDVADKVAFMGEGRVLAMEPMQQLVKKRHPKIREYFSSPRLQQSSASVTGGQDG